MSPGSIISLSAIVLVALLLLYLARTKGRSVRSVRSAPFSIPFNPAPYQPHTPLADPAPKEELRHFMLQVHGIYHRNSNGSSRQGIIRNCRPGEVLLFVPEPDNPHDQYAIKVCRENGEQLGYLDAGNAMRITGELSIGWTFRVTVDGIFAADRRGYFGCKIRVGVLTMSERTEARRKKKSATTQGNA